MIRAGLVVALCLAPLGAHAQEAPSEGTVEATPAVEPASVVAARAVLDEVERFRGVTATYAQGVVRLSGTVPSVDARESVRNLFRGQPGVVFVDDLLEVEAEPPPSAAAATDDDAVRERLVGVFRQIPSLEAVQVRVQSGVVVLEGEVADGDTRNRAVALAERQANVVFVDDRLTETTDVRSRLAPAADAAWGQLQALIASGPLLVVAALVMLLFAVLAGRLRRWDFPYRRIADRPLLRATMGRVVWGVTMGAGALIALEILDATALVGAVVGTAGVFGLAVGFAFQDIVENYLAGLMLSLQQPFGKDDLIEVNGLKGLVMRLTPRNTLLMTPDGNHVFVPNATVFKSQLTNYSRNPFRRFDFEVGVGVDEDLTAVIATGMATLDAMEGVPGDPPPAIRIGKLGDSSVVVQVFGWVDQRSHDFLAVRTEAIRRIKEAFDAAGYDMPEPIYRVSMQQVAPAPKKAPAPHPTDRSAVPLERVDDVERQARSSDAQEPGPDLLGS